MPRHITVLVPFEVYSCRDCPHIEDGVVPFDNVLESSYCLEMDEEVSDTSVIPDNCPLLAEEDKESS